MKLFGFLALFLALTSFCGAADTSYLVIRLYPQSDRTSILRLGAVEVNHPDLREDEVLVLVTGEQIEQLQNNPAVQMVYPASQELIAGVPVNGCLRPEPEQVGQLVMAMGRGWDGAAKGSVKLTYSYGVITEKLGRERVQADVERALTEWSRYVQVDFSRTDRLDAPKNLNFSFFSGSHGDGYPFDGRGRQLAHTFYPADINVEPIAGDLHFDEDENWGSGVDPDFYSVLLHELGHALGLGHSDRPGAIMYPYYRRLEALLPDDITAIRGLYAARNNSTEQQPSVVTPTPPVETPSGPTEEVSKPKPTSDKTAPKLTITSPATAISATGAATARVAGSASDNDAIEKITWSASGGRSGVADGTSSWNFTIPLRTGDNAIIIRAYDRSGNSSWRNVTITRR